MSEAVELLASSTVWCIVAESGPLNPGHLLRDKWTSLTGSLA